MPLHLALAMAGAALIVAGCGMSGSTSAVPTSSPLPSGSVPPTPAITVAPTPTEGVTWQLGAIPPMFEGGMAVPMAITGGSAHFVAVGGREFADRQAPAGGTAGIWRSPDGLAWETATRSAALAIGDVVYVEPPNPGLLDVASGAPGFVAIGWLQDGGKVIAGTWHSPDGLAWTRTMLPDAAIADLAAVTWSGAEFVIVGGVRGGATPRAAAWRSPDGRSWVRVPDSAAFSIGEYITYPGGIGFGGPRDVTAGPTGGLVAVGSTCTGTARMEEIPVCGPWAASSTDGGETWAREPLPSGTMTAPTSVAAGSVAVASAGGTGIDERWARLLVRDGDGWRVVDPAGVPRLERVLAYGGGFLGLATVDDRLTLWASRDGEAWTQIAGLPQPADATVLHDVDLAARGGTVAIAGYAEVGSRAGYAAFSIVGSPELPAGTRPIP